MNFLMNTKAMLAAAIVAMLLGTATGQAKGEDLDLIVRGDANVGNVLAVGDAGDAMGFRISGLPGKGLLVLEFSPNTADGFAAKAAVTIAAWQLEGQEGAKGAIRLTRELAGGLYAVRARLFDGVNEQISNTVLVHVRPERVLPSRPTKPSGSTDADGDRGKKDDGAMKSRAK